LSKFRIRNAMSEFERVGYHPAIIGCLGHPRPGVLVRNRSLGLMLEHVLGNCVLYNIL